MNKAYYPFIILTILFFITHKHAEAQNTPIFILGKVLDAKTLYPIHQAKVSLSGTSLKTSTNTHGSYVIQATLSPKKHTIVFSHNSYKSKTQELILTSSQPTNDTITLNVLLTPNSRVSTKADKDIERKKRLKLFEYVQASKLAKVIKAHQLRQFIQNTPQEKVYLHQDKPYYVLGDTIWISGYVIDAQSHQPSQFSKVLYVDLIDQHQQLKQQLKLKVKNGKVAGDMILDMFYTPGMYRLRAYTKLMTTGDKAYLFQRRFEVGQVSVSSFGGSLTHQNKVKDNQELVEYKLLLQDQLGQTLANSEFDILIKTRQNTYSQQKLTTDAQRIIQGKLRIPIVEKSSYLELIAKAKDTRYKASQSFYIPITHTQLKVSFFPEGGNLVAGAANRVAFKAINIQGLGATVKGKVLDESGKQVTTFQSQHLGMGSFTFTPEINKKYTAVVANQRFDLPNALPGNFVLNIQTSSKNRSVLLLKSPSTEKEKFTIIGHCRGKPIFTASGTVMKNQPFNTMLDHDQLPSGILTFTVFDQDFIPQCERIIFSRNPQKTLQIKIDTSLKVSAPRTKVTLNFDVNTFYQTNSGVNLSVAVVDETLVKENTQQTHILSNLLLTSDIKGYVEQPNYYFKDMKMETRQALDLLMMTQGWRRFTWKEVVSQNQPKPKNSIEKSLAISGTVTKPAGRPVANASVTLLSLDKRMLRVTQTNQKGRFVFDNLNIYNSERLVFKAVTARGRTKLKVKLDKLADTLAIKALPEAPHLRLQLDQKIAYLQNQAKQVQLNQDLLFTSAKMLQEVEVKARRITGGEQYYSKRDRQRYSQPSYRIDLDIDHFKPNAADNFLSYIQGKVPSLIVSYNPNVGFYSISFRGNNNMMYLLDGKAIDIIALHELDLQRIAYIDIVGVARSGLYGLMENTIRERPGTFGGIIALYSKKNYSFPSAYRDKGIKGLIYQNGYSQIREFYVPPYDNPLFVKNKQPDYRSTIYWNPSVKVVNEKASVSFFNADAVTNYRVIIEGISSKGEIGRKTYVYRVQNKK